MLSLPYGSIARRLADERSKPLSRRTLEAQRQRELDDIMAARRAEELVVQPFVDRLLKVINEDWIRWETMGGCATNGAGSVEPHLMPFSNVFRLTNKERLAIFDDFPSRGIDALHRILIRDHGVTLAADPRDLNELIVHTLA